MHKAMLVIAVVLTFSVTLCLAQPALREVGGSASAAEQNPEAQKDSGKRGKKGKNTPQASAEFTQAVAESLLIEVRDSLQGHSPRRLLAAFDRETMEGYRTFEQQVEALFGRTESFRVHYNIVQTTVDGTKGVVLAEFDLEEIPVSGGAPVRRSGQLRFTMASGRQGWKIVEVTPRSFFS